MMWKDSYRLGVEQIDQQHRELFDMTEELVNAVEEGATAADYEKAVGFLQDYVIEHFRDEEAYLASLHARDLAAHQAEHQAFTETVENYGRRLKENGFDEKTMKDLAGTVTAWLIYHVVDTDQKSVTGAVQEEGRFRQCVELFAHSALEVLSLGEEFSRCRHKETGRELDILTDYLRRGPNGTYCLDSTDYRLPVKAGERLSVVRRTSRGALAKKDGATGWYLGPLV